MHLPAKSSLVRPRRRARAFTLTEMLITMAVFTLLMAALFSAHLMGMRMRRVSETKLSATASARKSLNFVRDEIRTAKTLTVGIGNSGTFTPIPNNSQQVGNALQIYPTTDTSKFIRYYIDTSEQALMRVTSTNNSPQQIADCITNRLAFTAEDYKGNTLTNVQKIRVIRMSLEFYQRQYALAGNTNNSAQWDYYRVQTRVTRRAID